MPFVVVAVTAYYNLTNRLADGHGVEALPTKDNDAMGRQIAQHGHPALDDFPMPSTIQGG